MRTLTILLLLCSGCVTKHTITYIEVSDSDVKVEATVNVPVDIPVDVPVDLKLIP